jgi:very-short-patch-repair endonuclease
VLFGQHRLILEIDGWAPHADRASFEHDRVRRNALVLAGYVVLSFTWRQLEDDPAWVVASVQRALRRTPQI